MDTLLLSTLINLRNGREWEDAHVPEKGLCNVCGVINHPFGADLSSEEISVRVKVLKARYIMFKKVVATNGVPWNMEDKVVVADDTTWKAIFQRDASVGTYYYRDEPEFTLLAILFGLSDVKLEFPNEVITLSDTTEVILLSDSLVLDAPIRGKPYDSPADSDEVTSPMPAPSARVRRKLFDVGVPCFDEMSSNKSPTRFKPMKEGIFSSPKGSLCASWSPCRFPVKHPRRWTVYRHADSRCVMGSGMSMFFVLSRL
ncbi:hypothetical protein SASPL_106180 [Salvia splendens]|uniref:Myb/SANT-like domain-containing protein n=1 Tax=Salvia splendens TaxID=180675 RepID=A0A8X8YQ50_SALSN|nr:uncharacterized protein LOC121792646 [Salvia splendens]XP_042046602.1 uncharacterized protein LOC121792646 [Salvia splendens]XP_042046603.1 uncharacterized protein LOC121792646 [Salvia splendens]XP_042046604.1 uncharacterized protein LOC121792646 [Salvia splendens]KAG6434542.1 hypothetical protein SASPL_106180 [Salvia splendens]